MLKLEKRADGLEVGEEMSAAHVHKKMTFVFSTSDLYRTALSKRGICSAEGLTRCYTIVED